MQPGQGAPTKNICAILGGGCAGFGTIESRLKQIALLRPACGIVHHPVPYDDLLDHLLLKEAVQCAGDVRLNQERVVCRFVLGRPGIMWIPLNGAGLIDDGGECGNIEVEHRFVTLSCACALRGSASGSQQPRHE